MPIRGIVDAYEIGFHISFFVNLLWSSFDSVEVSLIP